MTGMSDQQANRLRSAFERKQLTLYLGAGVSVGNGLPAWEKLVLAMYFDAIRRERRSGWRPYPNYLYAIAEWQLGESREPLEITARKLRKFYDDTEEHHQRFLEDLRRTLYARVEGDDAHREPGMLRDANETLGAVARLCEASTVDRGVAGVITYNYDNLLEIVLRDQSRKVQSVFDPEPPAEDALPIYHVHGFVPIEGEGSRPDDIVFTEEQYHLAARDPYSWSNLVQLRAMTGTTGLMIGLSLADRNIRRLLDAIARSPARSRSFILLRDPKLEHRKPTAKALDAIHRKAKTYLKRFKDSGIKSAHEYDPEQVFARRPAVKSGAMIKGEPVYRKEIRGIIEAVRATEAEQQTWVLKQLGVEPIWYRKHDEIPDLLARIFE